MIRLLSERLQCIRLLAKCTKGASKDFLPAIIQDIVTLHIAVCVGAMIIASAVMFGFYNTIKDKLRACSGDIHITKHHHNNRYNQEYIDPTKVDGLLKNPPKPIQYISPFIRKPMILFTKGDMESVICKGIDPKLFHQHWIHYIQQGRLPEPSGSTFNYEICISEALAKRLNLHVDDTVLATSLDMYPRQRKFKITGLYCTHLNDIDNHMIFCDLHLLQRLNKSHHVTGYEIFLDKGKKPTRALEEKILPFLSYDLSPVRSTAIYPTFYQWIQAIKRNTQLLIAFILIISGLTMVSTMMVQIMERSYMIGLLKALGTPYWQIAWSIVYNNNRNFLKGILYGNSLGLLICYLQSHFKCIRLDPTIYYMHYVPISWDWQSIVWINIMAYMLTSVMSGITLFFLKKTPVLENFKG